MLCHNNLNQVIVKFEKLHRISYFSSVPHGRNEAKYFLNVCLGLPDEETAQKVPVPSNINAKSILEPSSKWTPTSGAGLKNCLTGVLLVLAILLFAFEA